MEFCIKKGLDLPILGSLGSDSIRRQQVSKVAVLGSDFVGMKPSMLVKVGDQVTAGQPLFQCKKNSSAVFTSRFNGEVTAINRGEKRAFQSLELAVSSNGQQIDFKSYQQKPIESWSKSEILDLLVESGEWVSLRQRPFDKIADPQAQPQALFVTATDSEPLAPKPESVISKWKEEFKTGVLWLRKLTGGPTYVCLSDGSADLNSEFKSSSVQIARFRGPHPSGNVGTHMHFIYPPGRGREVWHIGYQNVIAIGHLVKTGQLFTQRVIGLAGPKVKSPQLIETYRGASTEELIRGQIEDNSRVISGSVINGHKASESFAYIGHFHNQVSVIEEDNKREFLGWQSPGLNKFSRKQIFLSKLIPGKKFRFGSSTNGSLRAMVPIGLFEGVMPLDILPTQLLRALVSEDVESAEELGCLELAEEDLALCTFVAPGKVDFGPILRKNLNMIEAEG